MTDLNRKGFEYYNEKPDIQYKEYGRNVENLVRYINKVEDRETRTKLCHTLHAMVRKLNPNLVHDNAEDHQKFWDHIHLISGLQLDVDGPYPVPELDILAKKPERLPYPKGSVKFKHYGQNLELMIGDAIKLQDPEERRQATILLGRLMKNFYSTWNKDFAEDSIIVKHIAQMSAGMLEISIEEVREQGLFDGVAMSNNWKPQPLEELGRKKKKNNNNNGGTGNKHHHRRRRR